MWKRSSSRLLLRLPLVLLALLPACAESEDWPTLAPIPASFGPGEPGWSPQPHRDKPGAVAATPDGGRVFVTLPGTSYDPGSAVAVLDGATGASLGRIEVGPSPVALAVHPSGRSVVVFHRLGGFGSVVDVPSMREVSRFPLDFYASAGAFTPDGARLLVANRWRDAVRVLDVVERDEGLGLEARAAVPTPVGADPAAIAVSADGSLAAVASTSGLSVSVLDAGSGRELRRVDVGAPAFGVAFAGDFLVVPTLGRGTFHPPESGDDGDRDGRAGDGTPNVGFQDLQPEIGVYRASTGEEAFRATADSLCCRDWGDVDPLDEARSGDLLPHRDRWVVGGSYPSGLAAGEVDGASTVWVVYEGSDQVQRFSVDPATGALAPRALASTAGHGPRGIAVAGRNVVVAHRLSETVGVYSADALDLLAEGVAGDLSGGEFPATDAEIGELVFTVTGPFTADGDGSCAACHGDRGTPSRAFSMPWLARPAGGSRATPAAHGGADNLPWFVEGALGEGNFWPELWELVRKEDFCCDDPTLWPEGPPSGCESDPPEECWTEPLPSSWDGLTPVRGGDRAAFQHPRPSSAPTRDTFLLEVAARVVGRTETFGDSLSGAYSGSGERFPLPLDTEGVAAALGLFLLHDGGLWPSPEPADTVAVARGRTLFESPQVACVGCHPAPARGIRAPRPAPARSSPRRGTPSASTSTCSPRPSSRTFPG